MARELRQSTSVDLPIGPFLDATDGVTPETSLTITQPDVRLKKNGGAWAQKAAAQTLSHEENGFYEVTLDATDTDTLGLLRLAVFESGAAPVWEDFLVLTQGEWDAKYDTAVRPTASQIAAASASAVWEEDPALHANPGTFAEWVLGLVQAVWNEPTSGNNTPGTFGNLLLNSDDILQNLAGDVASSVWSAGTRTLTELDEDSTTLDLDATIQAANDARFDAIDSALVTIATYVDTEVAAIKARTDEIPTDIDGLTLTEWMRAVGAVNLGKSSGFDTNAPVHRAIDDSKPRVSGTITSDGRTAVTLDVT